MLVKHAVPRATCRDLSSAIEESLFAETDDSIALRNRGGVYGARNILEVCPAAVSAWQTPGLLALLGDVLGPDFGLVRGLYFDKPPERSWSLPWHQDLTIAVREHRPSVRFRKPTVKAGVPHVEAPAEVLQRMLTLRIHLDDVTEANGPLQVLPGTHLQQHDTRPVAAPVVILAQTGDVLAMRPLLFHCSGASRPGTTRHRRVLHLEFAADRALPEGFAWGMFLQPGKTA